MLSALFLAVLAALLAFLPRGADATRDERTLSIYEIHTKETTTVTYKRDGKFIPQALEKLNWALRDWRTNIPTKMNPHLFDIVWQLQKDVGSTGTIHVISGHRTAKTNRRLRRRGGGQARKSQHVLGNAMDIHFTDVPMSRVRNAALVMQAGGVGYYPTSAIPFVHVDTARVRAWPRLPRQQLAMLFPYGHTKHRPARGGPLTKRDQQKARIRLAALARKKNKQGKIRLASLSASSDRQSLRRPAPEGGSGNLTKAPGLTRHASRLWINQPDNRSIIASAGTATKQPVTRINQSAPRPNTHATKAPGTVPASAPARLLPGSPAGLPASGPKEPAKARIRLASLTPETGYKPARTGHAGRLWVYGDGHRSSWLTEQPPASRTQARRPDIHVTSLPKRRETIARRSTPAGPTNSHMSMKSSEKFQKQAGGLLQYAFEAEKVAYAPTFDEEHPDELSYRPFQILPLLSSKPVAMNKTLVAMAEPEYNRIYELLNSSENIPMQFRPSWREAEALWNRQFTGAAILNIRKQSQN